MKDEQSNKVVRLGLIGCGFFAQNHLHAWQDLEPEGVQLSCVCDIDHDKARDAAAQFGVPRYYDDVINMLDKESLDLVDIVTQVSTHCVFQTKSATDSRRKLPPIPAEACH